MKKLYLSFTVLLALGGCALLGVQAEKFRQKLAVYYSTSATVRNSAVDLLISKKIIVSDAQNIQDAADVIRKGLDVARELHEQEDACLEKQKVDPKIVCQKTDAEEKLTVTIKLLNSLQDYVNSKGKQ